MNAMLLYLAAGRGGLNPQMLQDWIKKSTERRKWIFAKLADILFGLVCLFWGGIELKAQNTTGDTVNADDPSVPSTNKLNAIIKGLEASQKSTLLREFFRPLLVTAAELLAELMSPDPNLLGLLTTAAAAPPPPPPVNVSVQPSAPSAFLPAAGAQPSFPTGYMAAQPAAGRTFVVPSAIVNRAARSNADIHLDPATGGVYIS